MRKTIAATLIGTLFASGAAAQVDTNRIVDYTQYTQRATPIRDSVERYAASVKKYPTVEKSQKLGPEFWILGSALVGSTIADIEQTFKNKKNCEAFLENLPENAIPTRGCDDLDPLVAPYISSGRGVTYAIYGVSDVLALYLSAEMKKGGSKWWWVVPAVLTAGHVYGAINNAKGFEINITIVR